jgi:hypothetical protein
VADDAAALHQGHADLFLELADQRAHGRLRDEELLGRAREAAGLADEGQRLELT